MSQAAHRSRQRKKYDQIHGAGIWVWISHSFRYDHPCFLSSVDICRPTDLEFFFAMITALIEVSQLGLHLIFYNHNVIIDALYSFMNKV